MTTQVTAVQIKQVGGPDVMQFTHLDLPPPAAGEVRVLHTAIGLNFIDTYHRTGLYPVPLPSGLGLEAAGVVEALGEGVTHLRIGDRVAYGCGPIGAYSDARNMPANRIHKLPDNVDNQTGAAMMLKGMTARYLLRETYSVTAGETILFHAAAGGVGMIACQWAKALGATVIGTVGSAEKAQTALAHGCDYVINSSHENIAQRVREITQGQGVPVVYDGVGAATVEASLDSLQKRGLFVSFGNASGPITNFNLGTLSAKGSLYVTRPTLMAYVTTDDELSNAANDLFSVVSSGKVKIPIHQKYSFADVKQAHADLESRKTTGTSLLIP